MTPRSSLPLPPARGAAALVLSLVVVALVPLGAFALNVTIGAPAAGTWTASDTTTVSGNASAPFSDRHLLDTSADFAGGSEVNTTTTGNTVTQALPPTETYHYVQDFTGMVNRSFVDEHWMWNLTNTLWQITNDSSLSASPPSLGKSNTALQQVTWDGVFPGPLLDGRLSFKYMCQANGQLTASVSSDGGPANQTSILSTGASAQTQLDYNLTTGLAGSPALFVLFTASASSAASSFCAIDDFEVVANYTRTSFLNYSAADNFTAGANIVWNGMEGYWAVGGTGTVSDTPPALYHIATGTTSVWANWAFGSLIRSAAVSFHYQCEANAAIQAFVSGDGVAETRILNGARGAPHTVFSANITATVGGAKATFLRFASDATTASAYFCGVDDVRVNWTIAGNQNLTYTGLYTSPVVDLLYPSTLTGADWVATVPANNAIQVSFRSSPDNGSFAAWYALASSGAVPVPASGRYVQFRVNFTSVGGLAAASVDRLGVNYSAVARVEVSVNGGPWTLANGTTAWSAQVALAGGSNNITARVTDSTGATALSVIQLFRDTFPPSAPGQAVGPLVTNATDVTWTWGPSSDVGLGVDHYLVNVSLTPGGQELGADIAVSGTSYTASGLPDNQRVYLTVRAVDLAGLTGPASPASNGTFVDRTPPGAVTIQSPGPFTDNATLAFSWSAAADFGSGVDHYRLSLGTTAGAFDAAALTTAATNYTYGAALAGSTYFLTVAAVDLAGNEGPAAETTGTTVDQVPPSGPSAVNSPPAVTNASSLTWSWPAATDALSGVDHYLIAIGTSPGASDVAKLPWSSTTYTLPYVPAGSRYYFEVRAVDRAGNEGAPTSASQVLVDSEPPLAPALSPVAAFVSNLSQTVSWSPSADLPATNASGVDHYVVTVTDGATVNTTSVNGLSVSVRLLDGSHYTVAVAAVDRAGNMGGAGSVSFASDQSGPRAPTGLKVVVSDPAGPTFQASWDGTSDAGVGFKEYRVRVGTTPGGSDVADGSPSRTTSYSWTGKYDTAYFVTVWGVDNLGNAGDTNGTTAGVTAKKPGSSGGFLPGLEAGAALAALAAVAAEGERRRRRA